MIDVIMRGPVGMSSFMESESSFQSYFLARRVWEKFFPYLCTVIWPSPHGLMPVALAIDHSIKSLTALTLHILTYAIKDRYGAIDGVANDGGQSCYNG